MDKSYEIGRGGGVTTVRIKDHSYDVVEFTIKKYLEDEKGRTIVDSGYTTFFSTKEFAEFFGMITNDLRERFDNEEVTSTTNG